MAQPASPTLPEVLSLKDAAEALGITATRVRQLVVAGKIASKDKTFLRADVERLQRERAGAEPRAYVATRTDAQIAIRAFSMFREGKSILQVMIALELTPQRVRVLYTEYQTPLGKRAPLSEEDQAKARDKEEKAFAEEFDREQAERRKKNERDHAERLREMDETLDRVKTEKRKRR